MYSVTVSFVRAQPLIHPSVGILMNIKGMLHHDTTLVCMVNQLLAVNRPVCSILQYCFNEKLLGFNLI